MREYRAALAAQRDILARRISGTCGDTLVLTGHPAVLTIGRQGSADNITVSSETLRARGIEVLEVERGGDITFHGPGQLVAYPIFRLPRYRRDVKAFIRAIERAVVATCREFGAPAVTIEGLTGVWTGRDNGRMLHLAEWSGEKKIASIGLAFKRWTSYHGVALNVSGDLAPFSYIHLCGLKGKTATSLAEATGRRADIEEVKRRFVRHMREMWREFNRFPV